MLQIPDEHTQLWPYCTEQFEKMPVLMSRFKAWKSVMDELILFLQAIETLELEMAKEHAKLARQLQQPSHAVLATNREILIPLQAVLQQCNDEHTIFAKGVTETYSKRLQELRNSVVKKIKSCKNDLDRLSSQILKDRSTTVHSISQHEKAKSRRIVSSGRDKIPVDPWLTERVLYRQIKQMLVSENSFQFRVLSILEDMGNFDSTVVLELRTLLQEFGNARARQYDSIKSQWFSAINATLTMDPGALFRSFDEQHELQHSECLNTPRNIQGFPYAIHEIKIVKQAVLFRPGFWNLSSGGARGGRIRITGANASAALTLAAQRSHSQQRSNTIGRNTSLSHNSFDMRTDDSVETLDSEEGEDDLFYSVPRPRSFTPDGVNKQRHYDYISGVAHTTVPRQGSVPKYRTPVTSASFAPAPVFTPSPLARSKTTVRRNDSTVGGWSWSWKPALFVLTESGYLHCFKKAHGITAGEDKRRRTAEKKYGLAVPPTPEVLAAEEAEEPAYDNLDKPSTYYSISLAKAGRVSVDVVTDKPNQHIFAIVVQDAGKEGKGCTKFEIKAGSEEEMIEWIGCLKAQIDSFIPDEPPMPLFHSATEIQEMVDETALRARQSIKRSPLTESASSSSNANIPIQTSTSMSRSKSVSSIIKSPNAATSMPTSKSATSINRTDSSATLRPEDELKILKAIPSSPPNRAPPPVPEPAVF